MSRNLSEAREGFEFDFSKYRIAIIQSVYHREITDKLNQGAKAILKSNGVGEIYHIEAPGAYELIYLSDNILREHPEIDGIITLGCVIKGDTDHDVYINHAVAHHLAQLELNYHKPIGFGLLTTNTPQQAIDRSGGMHGNKGEEVAFALLHTLSSSISKQI